MTRTKTNKLVAILMAIFMAFAFMSFSLTYVSAADNDTAASADANASGDNSTNDNANADNQSGDNNNNNANQIKADEQTTKEAPTPTISITTYTYGAPDIKVTIDFGEETPKIDYSKKTDTDVLKTITDNIKVYSDKELTKQVNYTGAKFNDLQYTTTNNKKVVSFTVPLNKSNLSANSTFYLFLGKALNETTEVEGADSFFEFKTNATTTSTTRTTTRTTYRTVSTTRTVKAKSANTGDNANLPLWIGLAAVAALMMGAVYFAKEKE